MKKIIIHAMMSMICITTSVVFTMDKDTSTDSESVSPAPIRPGTPFGSPLISPDRSPGRPRRKDTPPAIVYLQHQIKENKKDKAPKTSEHHSLTKNLEARVEDKVHELKKTLHKTTDNIAAGLHLLKSDNEQAPDITVTYLDGSPVKETIITPVTTPPATPRVNIPTHPTAPATYNSYSASSAGKIEDEINDMVEPAQSDIPEVKTEISSIEKVIETAQKAPDTIKGDTANIKGAADTLSSEQKTPSSLKIAGVSISIIALIALLYHLDRLPANIMQLLDTYLPQFLAKNVSKQA